MKSFRVKSVALSLVFAMMLSTVSFAADTGSKAEYNEDSNALLQEDYVVYSPEFPEAYIAVDVQADDAQTKRSSDSVPSEVVVVATAYVEETYTTIDDETIVESRLLSEEEVNSIGVENFVPLEDAPVSTLSSTSSNKKGTLTISLTCTTNTLTSTKSKYSFVGTANWSGYDTVYSASNNPATGLDYIGLTWGGNFDYSNTSATARLSTGASTSITLCESEINKGLVWEFNEKKSIGGQDLYVKPATINVTLNKNSLEGNGNTTSAVLKYIHTYESVTGSISISNNGTTTAASITLSGVTKQWSIICTMTNLAY